MSLNLPWTYEKDGSDNQIRDCTGNRIMNDTMYYPWVELESDADWPLMVRMLNSHAALVVTLSNLLDIVQDIQEETGMRSPTIEVAHQLVKAWTCPTN